MRLDFPIMANIAAQVRKDSGRILNMIRAAEELPNTYHETALQKLDQAIAESRGIGYTDGVAYGLLIKGNRYFSLDSFAKAKAFYNNARSYSMLALFGKEKLMAKYYMNTAVIFSKTGIHDSAIRYMYKAIAIARHLKDTSLLIYSYINIAGFWIYNPQADRAIYYGKKALDLAVKTGSYQHLPSIYNTMAAAYCTLEDLENYFLYARKAAYWSRKTHKYASEAFAYSHLGYYYLLTGKPDSAAPFFQKQLTLADSLQIPTHITEGYRGLGQVYMDMKHYENALHFMQLTATRVEKAEMQQSARGADIYLKLSNILSGLKKTDQAFAYYKKYHTVTMELLEAEKTKAINEFEIKYRTAEKDYDLLQKELQISRQDNRIRLQNIWIGSISAGTILLTAVLAGLYIVKRQQKNVQDKQIKILQQEQEIGHLKAIMQGEEKERSRIAQELHDGIGGMMASMKMNFSAVKRQHPEIAGINGLNEVMSMLEETTSEVRKTAHNLMPNILLRYSLEEALRIYCTNINAAGELNITLRMYHQFALKKPAELFLYRIIQELIQNIVKHAHATEAVIEIERQGEMIHIIVEDNGRGFDTREQHAGMGLQNLQSRIRALQGAITIESAPEIGTTIQIHFSIHQLNILTA